MKFTDAAIKTLPAPLSGNKVYYDGDPAGFGVRVTAAGIRSFVFTYRVRGSQRQRQITIGRCSNWTSRVARDKARALRRQVDDGGDPLGQLDDERQAPTVNELADRFTTEQTSCQRHDPGRRRHT
jgi:Arm DNA-binding domain